MTILFPLFVFLSIPFANFVKSIKKSVIVFFWVGFSCKSKRNRKSSERIHEAMLIIGKNIKGNGKETQKCKWKCISFRETVWILMKQKKRKEIEVERQHTDTQIKGFRNSSRSHLNDDKHQETGNFRVYTITYWVVNKRDKRDPMCSRIGEGGNKERINKRVE